MGETVRLGEVEMADQVSKERVFFCPHCGGEVGVSLRVEVIDVYIPVAKTFDNWRLELNPGQIEVVDRAKETGLFDAFTSVARHAIPDKTPRNMERFFASWINRAVSRAIPRFALDLYVKEFENATIGYFMAQSIGMVVAKGFVRCFVPDVLVSGQAIRASTRQKKGIIPASEGNLLEWVRTRNGYVIGHNEFFEAMQKKSKGDFALPGI